MGAVSAAGLQVVVTGGHLLYQQFAGFQGTYGRPSPAGAVLLGFWLMLSNATLLSAYGVMLRRRQRRTAAARPARATQEPDPEAASG